MTQFTRSACLFVIVFLFSIFSWAKKTGAAINISGRKEDSLWNYLPWIWVTGGAIFILFLVAVIRTHQKKYN